MAFWKDSMINRLSNLINRNRSAAKISQVLCSIRYAFFGTIDDTDLALFTADFDTVNLTCLCYQCVAGKSDFVFNFHLICSARLWSKRTGIDQTNPIAVPSTSPPSRGRGFKIGNMA